MKTLKSLFLIGLISLFISSTVFAQQTGSISGQVTDSLGGGLAGATVTIVDAAGNQKQVRTDKTGTYNVTGLAPGKYTVKAIADKFSLYENTEVVVAAGKKEEIIVTLTPAGIQENVEINTANQVSTDPADNKDATVLTEEQIKDLPDDPDELQEYLQALAGPGAGPDGAQFNIDGFSGGRLPPKEAIREIRINSNPFSAEYDRQGFGRIDILTKPGFDKFRGSADFRFNDESLNSRSPFSANRAPSQQRNFGGFLSGPIKSKKSSFFVDINQSQNDSSSVINATILNSSLVPTIFNPDIRVPSRRFSVSPRLDYQINNFNTLVARYSFQRNTSENQGVSGFVLPSRAFNSSNTEHEIRLTESAIINPKTVNETRFSYEFGKREQIGDNSIPSINVANSFFGGGAQIGDSYTKTNRWEINNSTTTTFGKNAEHPMKFGVRVRGVNIEDRSENGYGGSFTFAGVFQNTIDPNTNLPVQTLVYTSLEQYRQKLLGNPDPIFNPTQFNLTVGNPLAKVTQYDYSFFVTDDWKVRKDLTLSLGLRYENQTNISDNLNFAPRVGFAWAPGAGGARQPHTTIRGAFGVFYDRFGENTTLTSIRNDGISQLTYTVTPDLIGGAALLGQAVFTSNGVTNLPTAAQLASFAPLTSIPRRISSSLQSPYSVQSAVSVERTLPFFSNTVVSGTFVLNRSLHSIRLRNINAPVCPTAASCPSGPGGLTAAQLQALRPNPALGNVYEYESSGYSNSQFINIGFRTRLGTRVNVFANYNLSFQKNNADGSSFPAYTYNLADEYAESAFISRHRAFIGGSIGLPFGFRLSPTIIVSSGRRFNITSGIDTNRDSLFTERPTFAALGAACKKFGLTSDFCNINGIANPDTTIIPRNYGMGPGSFNVNMNLSKTFSFGGSEPKTVGNNQNGQNGQNGQTAGNNQGGNRGGGNRGGGNRGGGNRGGGGGGGGGQQVVMMGGGGGGGMFMMGGGGDARKPYNLTLGMNVNNVFNTVNLGNPISSISSPNFGRTLGGGGGGFFGPFGGGGGSYNRRVDLSARFSW